MSKVFEALQYARTQRGLAVPGEKGGSLEMRLPAILDIQGLPPLTMEKEMSSLHQSITSLLAPSKKVILQFIGSRENEGTSTIVREFGRFLSEKAGKSVLLVDGDYRKLSQHQAFMHHSIFSLQDIVHEDEPLERSIYQVRHSQMFLTRLASHSPASQGSSSSVNGSSIWGRLRSKFDFSLIDSPPLSGSDESLALCSVVDGVILIVEAEQTRSQVIARTKNRIVQQGGSILGLVFNKQRYYIPEWVYRQL